VLNVTDNSRHDINSQAQKQTLQSNTLWKTALLATTYANNTTYTPCELCEKNRDQQWPSIGT
ncbi:hypothetical protein SK128_022343, partial [Halocaridina rubra]